MTINSSTGLISGIPTTAGTVTATVSVTDRNGVTATSDPFKWAVLTAATVCVPEIELANGSFENSVVKHGAPNWMVGGSTPLLWDTTETDNVIELWKNDDDGSGPQAQQTAKGANGGQAISAEDGSQWAELNANYIGALYQDLPTVSGQVLQWSVWHRGRYSDAGKDEPDVMQVKVGSTTKQTAQVPTDQTTPNISDNWENWHQYKGVYTVPAGQTTTRFQFEAVSTASGNDSIGNFIDDLALNNYVACLDKPAEDRTNTVDTTIGPLQMSASRGSGKFTWGGGETLPIGLTLDTDTGLISGTPTETGTRSVVLTFTDKETTFEQSVSFAWTVAPKPTITPRNQITLVDATNVSYTPVSTCPNAPCSFLMSGAPPGLSINNSTGVITGTVPATEQIYSNVVVTITDAANATVPSAPFTWTVTDQLTITPVNQTTTTGATSTDYTPAFTCPKAPCTFTMTGAPPGIGIDSISGAVTGTVGGPVQAYNTVVVTIRDATGRTVSSSPFTWTVKAPPTVISPANQANVVGASVNVSVGGNCPNSPCTFAINHGPPGLNMSRGSAIAGTVTGTPGSFTNVTVTVIDAVGVQATSAAFTWTIAYPPLLATTPDDQVSTIGTPITALQLSASGGSLDYTWSGGLPAGLSMTSAGRITGKQDALATNTVTLTVTDNETGGHQDVTFRWAVVGKPTITPTNQTTTLGARVSVTLPSTCPNSPCTFAMTGQPSGLHMNAATGEITGVVNGGTQIGVVVTIVDAADVSVSSSNFIWTVKTKPAQTALSAQKTTIGAAVNVTVPAPTCPNSPCTRTLNNGPTGLSIIGNAVTGIVGGTAQTYNSVTITATDAAGVTATSPPFTWTVNSAPTLTAPGNQTARGGTADSLNLSTLVSGGTTPYIYSATGLPAWLTLNTSTGAISGTAPAARSVTSGITVGVRDSAGVSVTSAAFQWVVTYPSIAIPNQVTARNTGVNIDLDNYTTGGIAPYSYSITNKPAWLTYDPTAHTLIGTSPNSTSTSPNITVAATDSLGTAVTSAGFTWQIVTSTSLVWSAIPDRSSLPNVAATSLDVKPLVTNDKANYGAVGLPPGLTISTSTGVITGTPTLPGSYRVAVTATDNTNSLPIPSAPFTWQITDLTWTPIPNQTSTRNIADSLNVAPFNSGGISPVAYSAGGLPTGMTMSAAGNITGTPTAAGTVSVTVTATDLCGAAIKSAAFTWAVS